MKSKSSTLKVEAKLTNIRLCELAMQRPGVKDARVISPRDVFTASWVRLKCQFGCGGFGKSLVCPPFTPTPEQMRLVLDSYRRAILIHCSPQAEVKTIVAELERTIFLGGAWKTFGIGSGPCYFCSDCSVKTGQCRHPERARPSMEACGIDVFSTARKAGFLIEVVRAENQCPNYYGLILVD